MEISFSDIPADADFNNYPDDTVFILDDRPAKWDLETWERILPNDPRYDYYPLINMDTGEIIEPAKKQLKEE